MSDREDLERGYRRLLAYYPREFRRENGDEILGVLLASAPDGQRRVGVADAADLIRGALRAWLRPLRQCPPTVPAADPAGLRRRGAGTGHPGHGHRQREQRQVGHPHPSTPA